MQEGICGEGLLLKKAANQKNWILHLDPCVTKLETVLLLLTNESTPHNI